MVSNELVTFEKAIIELSYKYLFFINTVPVFKNLGDRYGYRFFDVLPKYKVTVLNNLNKLSKSQNFKTFSIHTVDRKTIFLLFNENSLKDVLTYLSDEFKYDDFLLMEIDLALCDSNRSEKINDSHIVKYKNYIESTRTGFNMNYYIKPEVALFKNKIYPLPNSLKKAYTKQEVLITPKGTVASVRLFGSIQHPNSDKNGYYCLGSLSDMKISDSTLDTLISTVKMFNLNSCYYIPNELVGIIKE